MDNIPRAIKAAAAVLVVGAVLNLIGGPFSKGSSRRQKTIAVSVGRAPQRARRKPISLIVRESVGTTGEKRPSDHLSVALASAAGEGFLTVQAFPACEVVVDGQKVGWAPFRVGEKMPLTSGSHQLVLKNHRLRPLATTIEVEPGQALEVKCWLDTRKLEVLEGRQ